MKFDVAKGDVTNVALPRICLDPSCVGRMDSGNVFEEHIIDIFRDIGRVAHTADTHRAGFVAGDVLDVDITTVAFDGYAVLLQVISAVYSTHG